MTGCFRDSWLAMPYETISLDKLSYDHSRGRVPHCPRGPHQGSGAPPHQLLPLWMRKSIPLIQTQPLWGPSFQCQAGPHRSSKKTGWEHIRLSPRSP